MEGDDGFLSLFRYYADLDLAFLKVKDGIRRVALPKDLLPLSICRNGPAAVHGGQKCIDVKGRFFLRVHKQLSRSIGRKLRVLKNRRNLGHPPSTLAERSHVGDELSPVRIM